MLETKLVRGKRGKNTHTLKKTDRKKQISIPVKRLESIVLLICNLVTFPRRNIKLIALCL